MSTERITIKHLQRLADHFNRETRSPMGYWSSPDLASRKTAIGHYTIDSAYGGWQLFRVSNEHGGGSDVLSTGHIPARELFNLMHAYLKGWRDCQDRAKRPARESMASITGVGSYDSGEFYK